MVSTFSKSRSGVRLLVGLLYVASTASSVAPKNALQPPLPQPAQRGLSFAPPVRIYSSQSRTANGGLYGDAFYSVGGGGGSNGGGFLFGTPGIVPDTQTIISTDGGQ